MFDAKGLLDQIMRTAGQQGSAPGAPGVGGLVETLSGVLNQATQGVKDGAQDIGLTNAAREAVARVSGGQTPEDLVGKVKALAAENQLATGAVIGGLGGVLLGSRAGRELAGDAAKLGAAALVGGLAYKAYQNYKSGKPLVATGRPVEAAPAGSGFEPQAMSNETAVRILRAMIAAAAADGRIDQREREHILQALRQSGTGNDAGEFLLSEISAPASTAAIAEGMRSETEALEIYTAARITIEPDTDAERAFLADLAKRLSIDPALVSQIDATARRGV